MKNIKRFVSILLAITMVVCMVAITASASGPHLDTGEAKVYLDDKSKEATTYVDGFGEIRAASEADIRKIFAAELDGVSRLPLGTLVVTDWADYYGYAWSQDNDKLYIYTDNSDPGDGDTIVYPGNPTGPADPTVPVNTSVAEAFVNGLRVNTKGVTYYGGEFFVTDYKTLTTLFSEAKKLSPSSVTQVTSLRTWATKFGYKMVASSNRVYLNNNGQLPIEMTLNGKHIDFPKQQPFVVNPGRTMVPIRVVSEELGAKVTWEGYVGNDTHSRVKIQKDNNLIYLWIGVSQFWVNGKYYRIDVAPSAMNDTTMVPARFVSEALGYNIKCVTSPDAMTVVQIYK